MNSCDQRTSVEEEMQAGKAYYPTLGDLREGRVSAEAFLASRNHYRMEPFRVREITVPVK